MIRVWVGPDPIASGAELERLEAVAGAGGVASFTGLVRADATEEGGVGVARPRMLFTNRCCVATKAVARAPPCTTSL